MIRRIRLQYRAPQDREAWQKQYYEPIDNPAD